MYLYSSHRRFYQEKSTCNACNVIESTDERERSATFPGVKRGAGEFLFFSGGGWGEQRDFIFVCKYFRPYLAVTGNLHQTKRVVHAVQGNPKPGLKESTQAFKLLVT